MNTKQKVERFIASNSKSRALDSRDTSSCALCTVCALCVGEGGEGETEEERRRLVGVDEVRTGAGNVGRDLM